MNGEHAGMLELRYFVSNLSDVFAESDDSFQTRGAGGAHFSGFWVIHNVLSTHTAHLSLICISLSL